MQKTFSERVRSGLITYSLLQYTINASRNTCTVFNTNLRSVGIMQTSKKKMRENGNLGIQHRERMTSTQAHCYPSKSFIQLFVTENENTFTTPNKFTRKEELKAVHSEHLEIPQHSRMAMFICCHPHIKSYHTQRQRYSRTFNECPNLLPHKRSTIKISCSSMTILSTNTASSTAAEGNW